MQHVEQGTTRIPEYPAPAALLLLSHILLDQLPPEGLTEAYRALRALRGGYFEGPSSETWNEGVDEPVPSPEAMQAFLAMVESGPARPKGELTEEREADLPPMSIEDHLATHRTLLASIPGPFCSLKDEEFAG
jgi:hypothetical protein